MKNFLFIVALFIGFMFVFPTVEKQSTIEAENILTTNESFIEDSANNMQHQLFILSSTLQSSKGILTPTSSVRCAQSINIRLLKDEERMHECCFVKQANILSKINHTLNINRILKLSSFQSVTHYKVYGLRKIII